MFSRLGLLSASLLMAVALVQGGSASSLVAGVAAVAIASAVAARYGSSVVLRSEVLVRVRARAKSRSQAAEPAPQHPRTPGRRRSRAPSESIPVAL